MWCWVFGNGRSFFNFKQPTFWRYAITGLSAAFLFLWIYGEGNYLDVGRVFEHYAQPILFGSVIWWLVALFFVVTYPKSSAIWGKHSVLQFFFCFFMLIPFLIGVLLLRLDRYVTEPYHGIMLLLYVFILVWVADSGAYFVGRKFGKHKLAPKVSPGKSWQGAIGGLVMAGIVAAIFVNVAQQSLTSNVSPEAFIGLSVATVAISILGDLTESMFKRQSGIKDSSNLIPGHGGILDRIDSLTAAVPFFACFYFFVL